MKERTTSRRIWFLIAAALSVAFLAVGCDKDTSTPDLDDPLAQTEDIDDPFGGFNTSDETVGFGDPFLLSDEGETDYADQYSDDPDVNEMVDDAATALFGVRLTWGYLERDSTHSDAAVDWTGSAVVDSGALLVRRTIQFEPGQDYIVRHSARPLINRREVNWVSTTTVAFDGVQLLIVDPTGGDGPNGLTLTVPLLGESFEIAELADLDMTFQVDDAGHELRIQARRVEPTVDCRQGWLSGQWRRVDPQTDAEALQRRISGRFRGHWTDDNANIGGFLRGIYGVNHRGHRVYFGKLIDREGHFLGLMRGTWEPSSNTPGTGTFHGAWMSREHQVFGGMRGIWMHRGDDGVGFFHGGWRSWCDDSEVEDDPSIF